MVEFLVGKRWFMKHAVLMASVRPFDWTRWGFRKLQTDGCVGGSLFLGPLWFDVFVPSERYLAARAAWN